MLLHDILQDTRLGLRVLIKEKGFSSLAILVLAIGISAVATQFAIVNGVLLRGLDFREADRLVDVQMADPTSSAPSAFSPANFDSRITLADFDDLKRQQRSFSDFVGYVYGATVNLTWQGQPMRLMGAYVTHDFFRALGVVPAAGRDFVAEDDRRGVDNAVLLSDALWRGAFGGDPGVVGKAIRVNGRTGTVVGIMPPGFAFPTSEQIWLPVRTEFADRPRNDPAVNTIAVIAKLSPGVSREQAAADVTALARALARSYPDTNKLYTLGNVRPLLAVFTGGNLQGLLYTMLAFCAGVLLIACVNVMNMQFARVTLRLRELCIRSSLGATRGRLIRQMLTESLLLAGLGTVLGVGLSYWLTGRLNQLFANLPNALPSWMSFAIDLRVLGLAVAATLLSALVAGFVPAWFASRAKAIGALSEGARGNSGRTVGAVTRWLVVFQIAVTFVLLVGAVLEVLSITRQQRLDYGYDTRGVLGARIGLMEGDYPSAAQRRQVYEAILREMQASPQFEGAAITNRFRMVYSGNTPIEIEGRQYQREGDRPVAEYENVTPGYGAVLRQRVVEGRGLVAEDSERKEPVAVVNAAFARRHFGAAGALQRRFRAVQPNGTQAGPWRTIVGIVTDVRMQSPFDNQSDGSGYYVPYFDTAAGPVAEQPQVQKFATLLVRPRGGQRPEAVAAALQAVVSRVDPNLPLYSVGSPQTFVDGFLGPNRLIAGMFSVFGAVAVLLASVGLYGVMSFSVNQRRQEFGVRMALGADAAGILGMVLRQAARPVALGLVLGLGAALALASLGLHAIADFLFQTNPRDPAAYLAVGLLLMAVSGVAIIVPARRATGVDPMVALRNE